MKVMAITFKAIDSETEAFPKGSLRKNFADEYLQKLDEEKKNT